MEECRGIMATRIEEGWEVIITNKTIQIGNITNKEPFFTEMNKIGMMNLKSLRRTNL